MELIFAIVVMGIAVLSVPTILNMISQTSTIINSRKEIANTTNSMTMQLHDNWDNINATYATTDEKWGNSPLYFNNIFQKTSLATTNIKLINISTPNISMSAFYTKPTDLNLTQVLIP